MGLDLAPQLTQVLTAGRVILIEAVDRDWIILIVVIILLCNNIQNL